jgi:non-canonical purine NTP pyrophosphatase (RdgB/HAM1 family)
VSKPKLIFVTGNPNKLEIARVKLTDYEVEHIDFEVAEIQSMDPREIVEHKLKEAYAKAGQPCFVWDVAFGLDCLDGFPGPLIKWFFAEVGDTKICRIVDGFGDRGCGYRTVLGYFDGAKSHFFEVARRGNIPEQPRGANGFDWDTIFIPDGEKRTYAEMSFEEKHSHTVANELLDQFSTFLKKP